MRTDSSAIDIRRLRPPDAPAYRRLRLRALREHPEAFLISYDEERRNSVRDFARRFRERWSTPDNGILGAFFRDRLVGLCGFGRERPRKYSHKAVIWGMYVASESRGLGLGRALLTEALRQLAAVRGVEQVNLGVVTANKAARSLYRSMGFRTFGLEERALKLGRRYLAEEFMTRPLRRR